MSTLEYVRTDRNGTKIYHDWTCPRCGGAGESDKWWQTGRTCYACGGTGIRATPRVVKEYTPEYQAKLDARRAARNAKRLAENPPEPEELRRQRIEEARLRNWEYEGFQRSGVGYVHTGNTYRHKEAIKEAGGRWNMALHAWLAPEPIKGLDGVRITELHAQDVCGEDGYINPYRAAEINY